MASIGSIAISVYAQTSGLRKSLAKAQGMLKKFTKEAKQTLKTVSIGVGAGITAGIAAITAAVSKYSAEIDKMAKFSTKFGITVNELQRFYYAAELTGVSVSTMNMSIQKMVRNVSEASVNIGTAKEELIELGLSAEKLNKMSPSQQFVEIGEALANVANQNDAVRMAVAIFGRSGTDVLNTFKSNVRGLFEEFDKLDAGISQSQARMIELFNDTKSRTEVLTGRFGAILTAELAAPLQMIFEKINQTIMAWGGMRTVAKQVAKVTIDSIASMINGFSTLTNVIRTIIIYINKIILGWQELGSVIGTISDALAGTDIGGFMEENIKKTTARIKGLENSIMSSGEEMKKLTRFSDELKKSVGKGIELGDAEVKQRNIASGGSAKLDTRTGEVVSTSKSKSKSTASETQGLYRPAIQKIIDSMPEGKALQKMFGRDKMASQETQATETKNKTTITLNMVTDAGKVAGELTGNKEFIRQIEQLQYKNTRASAKAATQ